MSLIERFSVEQAYFTIGADARIDFSSESNFSNIISALPLNVKYTEITKLNINNYLMGERLVLYVINPSTFLSATYFNEKFSSGRNVSEIINKIA